MSPWTNDELTHIANADELQIAPLRGDGTQRTAVPVWVVRDGDGLYVRSYKGAAGAWYRAAQRSHAGHIRSGGVDADVSFTAVGDTDLNDRLDAAYRTKYGRYGDSYIKPMVAARDTTLRVVPR